MKKIMQISFLLLLLWGVPGAAAAELLVPVGQVVALELENDSVTVAAFADDGCGGLQVGDEIQMIDGRRISCAEDVRAALEASDGTVEVQVLRGTKTLSFRLTPKITAEGPRLGVFLRQGVTGIGTVTYYDPDSGKFGALGHGVSRPDGRIVEMEQGFAYAARVLSVKRGRIGAPGQLIGALSVPEPLGSLSENTPAGIFGTCGGWKGQPIPTAQPEEIHAGTATILSTVSGGVPREYSVEILKIYPDSDKADRNLLIRVTDPKLLEATGGIVQGMSGSPIIQDGKLVGAVTHVLVNDPTTGYGIFIENMLDAAA
jgi:stage IV sporulation protein B